MNDKSLLFIETRSTKGTDYDDKDYFIHEYYSGLGKKHPRLLFNSQYLKSLFEDNDFICDYMVEENNLSIYKDDNPYLIRMVLRKGEQKYNLFKNIVDSCSVIQKKLVKFFDKLIKVFEENNINYVVFFGNLLSLLRHGTICLPWDDDIDICLTTERVNILISLEKKYNFYKIIKGSNSLYWCKFEDVTVDLFIYPENFIDEYELLNGYRIPKNYSQPLNDFYSFSNWKDECFIYNHHFNDRWANNDYLKFKLSLRRVNHYLKKMNYKFLS